MTRKILTLIILVCTMQAAAAQYHPEDHVYQYSVKVGSRDAYLWIPPKCKSVRGVIIALSNLLERNWLEAPVMRRTAAKIGLAIIWIGPAEKGDELFTADMKPGMDKVFQKMMDDLAVESGYSELKTVPVIPTGHSANGHFAWTFASAFPERTIAAIPVKTVPYPDSLRFKNIPVCYIVGQTTEWPQFRVPDPATTPGERDFYWPVVKNTALALRAKDPENLVSVVTDPGGGHFDWSDKLSDFMVLFIRKACHYRLPDSGETTLKPITKEKGWMTGTGGMVKDEFNAAPYGLFKGGALKGYWFFDKQIAEAAVAFEGDRVAREKQMPTFLQDGKPLPVAKLGYAALKFEPENDGVSFNLTGGFLTALPPELIGAGNPLGHAQGPVRFKIIKGPAIQAGNTSFKLQFDRGATGGELWLMAEHPGNYQYRHAVQPGMMRIPSKLTDGTAQNISFDTIPDINIHTRSVMLNASSTSGLPVSYYVTAGPAYIAGNKLKITQVPPKSRMPVKVTVIAYQWGKMNGLKVASAIPIIRTFYIKR
ncbi:hypothetical protein SAMN05192574_105192 [Mucilaginibacter gossypiicola]|uniref:PhoPQ-activated pathogenicity-related protein n=1 Tax=Mucilaginibacter gossypiicola TaxID=551995 RepID=A0A1H8LPK8_9SPHI|nr:hypothetical protein [Mucilaginibacter gossypiicola]SEO07055.1 hypothetical protein SAMN05192574_105192 [Mucilaginibacter gossypiicola]